MTAAKGKRIDSIVNELLQRHGITSPPIPVAKVARAEGLDVVTRNLEGDISGFIAKSTPSGGLIGVNSRHPRVRQRFTIAHELGHYFLSAGDDLHVDHRFELLKLRDDASAEGTDREEIEANAFAARFLMPSDMLKPDLEEMGAIDAVDESAIRTLAQKYQVSTQALLIRIHQLS